MSETEENVGRQAQRALKDADAPEEPIEEDTHPDRTQETRTPNFRRMRTEWNPHDAPIIGAFQRVIEDRLIRDFADVYQILSDFYDIVREPAANHETGEILTDEHGFTIWAREPGSGRYVEDFTRLGHKERDNLLFAITTRLVEWEQRSQDAWGEAMMAKAQWEERFSSEFVRPEGRLTVDDRANRGKAASQEERYFAVFQSLYSRKCEALVRSMERLAQRLKDANYS